MRKIYLLISVILVSLPFTSLALNLPQGINFCTDDVKMCPDGSYIGRSGPNCEFVCPKGPDIDDRIMCPMHYDPVCGVDGHTYGNSCMARGVEIDYPGECQTKPGPYIDPQLKCPAVIDPVCGADGYTYGNSCMAQHVGVKYPGECLGDTQEKVVQDIWEKFKKLKISTPQFLELLVVKGDEYLDTRILSSYDYSVIQYFLKLVREHLQSAYTGYINQNISSFFSYLPQINVKWKLMKITWLDVQTAKLHFSDGDLLQAMEVSFQQDGKKIKPHILSTQLDMVYMDKYDLFVLSTLIPTSWDGVYQYAFPGGKNNIHFYYLPPRLPKVLLFTLHVYNKDTYTSTSPDEIQILENPDYIVTYSLASQDSTFTGDTLGQYNKMLQDIPKVIENLFFSPLL